MNTEEKKNEALEAVSRLFSDTDADEREQIEALEEIENLCRDNIECLKEQLRNDAADDEG